VGALILERSTILVTVLALLAHRLLSWAFFRGPTIGPCDPLGVILVVTALALVLLGTVVAWPSRIDQAAAWLAQPVLIVFVVYRLVEFAPALMEASRESGYPSIVGGSLELAAVLAVASYRWTFLLWPRARLPILLAVGMTPSLWIITSQPRPLIDVLMFEDQACRLLLSGQNPYAANFPMPQLDRHVYGPVSAANEKIMWYPYMPVNLLAVIPGYLLGDVRYSTLAALVGTCLVLSAAARRAGRPYGSIHELIIVVLCLDLANGFIIRFGWTEPFLAFGVACCAASLAADSVRGLGLSLGWTVAAKQYGFLWAIPVLATDRCRWKALHVAALAALTLTLPFFLWSPRDFLQDLVTAHAREPFRPNLVSVPALIFSMTGRQIPSAWSFVAAGTVAALILARRPLSPPRAILGGTGVALAFVVFGSHGAPNFYWFTSVSSLIAAFSACLDQKNPCSF
jgi:hypothetical protein